MASLPCFSTTLSAARRLGGRKALRLAGVRCEEPSRQTAGALRRTRRAAARFFLALAAALACRNAHCEIRLGSSDDALKAARSRSAERELQRQLAAENVRLAKRNVVAFLPTLDFAWSENDRVNIGGDDLKSREIRFGVTQKIFDGGRAALEYRMRISQSLLEFYDFQKDCENFEGEVLRSYYANLLARAKTKVQDDAIENARQILQLAQIKLSEGMITKSEYLEAKISLMQMEIQRKAYIDEAKQSLREFKSLLSIPTKEEVVFDEEEIPSETDSPKPLGLEGSRERMVASAVENSLELKKLDAEIDWAKKQRVVQKMVFLPSISASGSVEFSGRRYPLTMPSYTFKISVGFENNPWLSASLSSGAGVKQRRLAASGSEASGTGVFDTTYFSMARISKINLAQKVSGRKNAALAIENSVSDFIEQARQNEEAIALNFELLGLRQSNLDLLRIRLDEGQITQSEFIEALVERSRQMISLLELKIGRELIKKRIEIFTGRKLASFQIL